ncbi:hypothetical protein J6590_076265 [Homalodisca vitripennis]|nr:hypothetical protein J6590_076265 [Homalodisca vitripennis]
MLNTSDVLVDWIPDYNSDEQSRTLTTPTPTLNTLFDTAHRNTTKHTECKYYTTYWMLNTSDVLVDCIPDYNSDEQSRTLTTPTPTDVLVDWAPDYNSNEQSRTLTTPTPTLNTLFDTVHRNTTQHTEC